MKELNVCFIGIGSIAKRHIKNLKKICNEDGINLSIDAVSRAGRKEEYDHLGIKNTYLNVHELNSIYDAIFITNPTEYHIDTLNDCTPYATSFFIEKPISSIGQIGNAEKYLKKEGTIYYVACPLRYNPVIQFIKENIKKDSIISVRSISSSYLPDWRVGQDYRKTYSAQRKLGGGVSTDLIHEWDYLTFLFGTPKKIKFFSGKKSKLEIDSDDFAIYIAEYSDKIVELHLDYFGRKTIREIELIMDTDTVIGDIANNRITFLTSGKTIVFNEERDDYQMRELRHFISMIKGNVKSDSDIEHAIQVLSLSQGRI